MRRDNFWWAPVAAVTALLLTAACSPDPNTPSPAERALEELQDQYDKLREKDFDAPVDWASEDIENIGDWDYRVVELSLSAPEEFEAALNELGNDRWEAFWIERSTDGLLVFLKRPSISYLSKIPLSQIGRFIIDGSGNE